MPTDGLTVRAAVVDRAQEDERRQDAAELRAIARRENGVNLSVVIPAKNEADNIGWVLERLPAIVDEVVLVDGHSTDGTVEVARRLGPDIRGARTAARARAPRCGPGFAAARATSSS